MAIWLRSPAVPFPMRPAHCADQADVSLETARGQSCASGNRTPASPASIALGVASEAGRGRIRHEIQAPGWPRTAGTACSGTISPAQSDAAQQARIESALQIWQESEPLDGTLGQRYFVERRGLRIGTLGLKSALRWHQGAGAVIGLMVDPVSGEACGVHRTFLNRDGTKRDRRMLGRMGVIRLVEKVEESLGVTEGIEDGLAVLLAGASPIWCATCAGAIERFPLLDLDDLHVYGDNDDVGEAAAERLAVRYENAGKHVVLHWPPDPFKDWHEALAAEGGAI